MALAPGTEPGQPVELRNDEGVALADGGERLVQAGRSRLLPVMPWSR